MTFSRSWQSLTGLLFKSVLPRVTSSAMGGKPCRQVHVLHFDPRATGDMKVIVTSRKEERVPKRAFRELVPLSVLRLDDRMDGGCWGELSQLRTRCDDPELPCCRLLLHDVERAGDEALDVEAVTCHPSTLRIGAAIHVAARLSGLWIRRNGGKLTRERC